MKLKEKYAFEHADSEEGDSYSFLVGFDTAIDLVKIYLYENEIEGLSLLADIGEEECDLEN